MPKVDKLICRTLIPPFLISLVVLTFVVFIHDLGRFAELLITRNASFDVIFLIAATILPGILIFSLPLSYLIGILIGLSGLSGESQITAMRACGIPLRNLLRPILMIGAAVGMVTGLLSTIILPQTNDMLRNIIDRTNLKQVVSQIQPRVFNESLPNLVVYIDDLAIGRKSWSGVFLVDNSDPEAPSTAVARTGSLITDSTNKRIQLHLEDGASYAIDPQDPSKDNVSQFASTDIPIEIDFQVDSHLENSDPLRPKKVNEQSTYELWKNYRHASPEERLEQVLELNRRISLPFSIFSFALLGLTLGINTKKGGRTSGFALSLAIVMIFYVLFFNGIRLASVGKISPWLGAWGANLFLAALGICLLTKLEQGFGFGHWLANNILRKPKAVSRRLPQRRMHTRMARINEAFLKSISSFARFLFPRVLDLYVSRGFFVYFFWSLMVCSTLFMLFTLFDLLDDIIRNDIPAAYVVGYFGFLMPHILMLIVPMSILLAILINFGILEKNSEITAIKAGGWSLYRIAIPVLLISAGFCAGLYFMQDYVLPYANIRQDSLRNIIKGTAQTSRQPQRKWIFGESNRIYNYDYFDDSRNLFVDLNVYDLDLKTVNILRRINAARATVSETGKWILEDGWIRDYQYEQSEFRRIQTAEFNFPEKPGYFKREIFQPKESSKMTYPELNNYINYLKKSAYNATELQVELHKKISFPMSCLVMALIAVPFSFSTGKKGAFFGIGLSIAIAISYWGISSVFEQMGAYGLLIPFLAAWAPNVLFAATGLLLIFTIRT